MMTCKSLRFEAFALDLERLCLHGPSGQTDLRRKSFEVLRYLVEHTGRVVTKEELIRAVWPHVTIGDESLTQCISEVRRALGEQSHRIIKTVPRRGYLFNVPISRSGTIEGQNPNDAKSPVEALSLALPLPDRASIAILPFTNLSPDPDQDYFADGMVEDIITALSRFKALFVIARNSSFAYKGRAVDVKQVGRELGVRYVLEGSVRKAPNRVRITGQLVDTATGAHLWAERFDGGLSDVFDLQDQVTESVVVAIAPAVVKAEIERANRKPTESLDAYALYLRGVAKFYQYGSRQANAEASRLFNRAIQLDPDFRPPTVVPPPATSLPRPWAGFQSHRMRLPK